MEIIMVMQMVIMITPGGGRATGKGCLAWPGGPGWPRPPWPPADEK